MLLTMRWYLGMKSQPDPATVRGCRDNGAIALFGEPSPQEAGIGSISDINSFHQLIHLAFVANSGLQRTV
jgi:hypothetical protein